jgi:hypothetical protein
MDANDTASNFALLFSIKRSRLNWVRFGDRTARWVTSVSVSVRTNWSDAVESALWRQKRAVTPCMSGHELKKCCRLQGDGFGSAAPIEATRLPSSTPQTLKA